MLLFTFYISVLLSLVHGQLDLSICGNNNVACFRDTENCAIDQCNAVATYQYNKAYDKVIIVLWGRQNWVAFGQRTSSSGSFMVNIRGQYCVRSGTILLGNFNGNSLQYNSSPQWVAKGNNITLLESKVMADGSFFCRFERSTTISNSNFYDLNKPLYAAIAFGSNIDKGNNPLYHGNSYRYSDQTINFLTSLYTSDKNTTNSTAIPTTTTVIATTGSTSNKLDLSICGKSNIVCFCDSEGCNISQCNAVATYQYDKARDKVVIVLWGKLNWVAFGQKPPSSESFMVNLRGQYCVRQSGTIIFGYFNGNSLKSNGNPEFVVKGNEVLLLESGTMADGSFFCRFERPTSLNNTNFYKLNSTLYAAIAFGSDLNGNYPAYHGNLYRRSSEPVDFLTLANDFMPGTTPTVRVETTSIVGVETNKLPDLSKCDNDFNCFRYPNDCSSKCVMIATFFYDKGINKYVKELWSTASNKWVAFAQKPDNSNSNFMVNLQGQYCLVSSSTVLFGNLDATSITINTSPQWIQKVPGVEMVSSAIYSDGSFSCRYTSSADNSSHNMFLAIAFGSSLNNGKPSYHGPNNYLKSTVSVDLMAIQRFSSGSSPNNLRKGHGILMTLAWLLFATCGIFMSRYMKPHLKTKIVGKDAWFRMHQFFMSSAVICFVIGLILILVDLKGIWSANAGAHHILGLIAIILGLIQPCIALLRCAPDHENRFIFNWVHRIIGVVAWFVADIAIIFGLKLLNINYVAVVVFIIVVFALFVLLDLILIKNSNSNESKLHITYSSTQFDMSTEAKENKTNKHVSMFFMVVLYAFVAAVAIAVAVLIGKS